MTSKRLSSKRIFAVCKTQLYQMRLLLVLFGLVLAILPTLVTMAEFTDRYWNQYTLLDVKKIVMGVIFVGGFSPMFGLAMGMAVYQFGYLHKKQKLDYFHAVPVLRTEHFFGRVLAAAAALLGAALLVALGQIFSVSVTLGFGGEGLLPYILWRCMWIILPALAAYLFTTLIIVLTATLWETVFSLLAVSALSLAVMLFTEGLITVSLPVNNVLFRWDLVSLFSPLMYSIYYVAELYTITLHSAYVPVVLVEVMHILICGGLALWIFCRRRSELAESNTPTRFKLLVRFSAAFCSAAFFSMAFLWITKSYEVYWLGALFGVALAWIVMELLYARSLRKAGKSLLVNGCGFAVFALVNLLVLFGFVGVPQIPAEEDVYAVSVTYGKEAVDSESGARYYESFYGNSEIIYEPVQDGTVLDRNVTMGVWSPEQVEAGLSLAEMMLQNQKTLLFPYIPRFIDGYSTTYTYADAADDQISYDVTVQLYSDGKVKTLSYNDVSGNGKIEEMFDRAKAIAESDEYRMSNPSLQIMKNLDYVQRINYKESGEFETYSLSEIDDPEDFIDRLQAAYIEDMHATHMNTIEVYEEDKDNDAFIEAETVLVPEETAVGDEYSLYMDLTKPVVLKGGLLDSMYPAKGVECWLTPEFVPGYNEETYDTPTGRAAIYFYRQDYPKTCAVLDELRTAAEK